jgi:hypothetical protein
MIANPAGMVAAVFVLWVIAIMPLGTPATSWRRGRTGLVSLPAHQPVASPVFEA